MCVCGVGMCAMYPFISICILWVVSFCKYPFHSACCSRGAVGVVIALYLKLNWDESFCLALEGGDGPCHFLR